MTFDEQTLKAAHRHSSHHRAEILASKQCGCFYCLTVFAPSEITEWVDDERTALCPKCPVDSVMGDASGYPVTDASFLKAMYAYWFERTIPHEQVVAELRTEFER